MATRAQMIEMLNEHLAESGTRFMHFWEVTDTEFDRLAAVSSSAKQFIDIRFSDDEFWLD
jgi:hypothetical protein